MVKRVPKIGTSPQECPGEVLLQPASEDVRVLTSCPAPALRPMVNQTDRLSETCENLWLRPSGARRRRGHCQRGGRGRQVAVGGRNGRCRPRVKHAGALRPGGAGRRTGAAPAVLRGVTLTHFRRLIASDQLATRSARTAAVPPRSGDECHGRDLGLELGELGEHGVPVGHLSRCAAWPAGRRCRRPSGAGPCCA